MRLVERRKLCSVLLHLRGKAKTTQVVPKRAEDLGSHEQLHSDVSSRTWEGQSHPNVFNIQCKTTIQHRLQRHKEIEAALIAGRPHMYKFIGPCYSQVHPFCVPYIFSKSLRYFFFPKTKPSPSPSSWLPSSSITLRRRGQTTISVGVNLVAASDNEPPPILAALWGSS